MELVKFLQINLDNVATIGIDCLGTYEVGDFAELAKNGGVSQAVLIQRMQNEELRPPEGYSLRRSCQICENPVAVNADISLGLLGCDLSREIELTVGERYREELAERMSLELADKGVAGRPKEIEKLMARRMGTCVDSRGFLEANTFSPVTTSRPGVFACGSMSGPKDIPESVMEASGAASAAAALLGGLAVREKQVEYPPEIDILGQPPRVGVFICRCGINIASTVEVPRVVDYVSSLPRVKHAQALLFACAQDSQKIIKAAIQDKALNRVVVCACTPRTHEPLFQKTLRETGLNPYLFEFANIREQCSWVHQNEPARATEKAQGLARQAVARVIPAEPLYKKTLGVNSDALIIGGGLAGMNAALDLAAQSFKVHLLEKEGQLGGNLRYVRATLRGEDTGAILSSLIDKVNRNANIHIYLNARIKELSGYVGNFKTALEKPAAEIEHGVVVIASGAEEYRPEEYLFGKDKRVVTQRRLEELLHAEDRSGLLSLRTVLMIQCVGSRDADRPYCSRVCCGQAVKNALKLKELNPGCSIYVCFRDIRTYGLRESYYRLAREKGVQFIRFGDGEEPVLQGNGAGLTASVKDKILARTLLFTPELVVLSTGIVANPENKTLSQLLKVPLNEDGFFLEAHIKLRPVDFATDGVFVCGLAHYPKDIGETIAQARGAAGMAATLLSKKTIEAEGKVATVRQEYCSGCGACASSCRPAAIDLRGFRNEQILEALQVI